MIDGNQADDKIIAVMRDDAVYGNWQTISHCPATLVERLRHYFLTYKDAPDATERRVDITHVYDQHDAHEVIRRSLLDYREEFGDPEGALAVTMQGEGNDRAKKARVKEQKSKVKSGKALEQISLATVTKEPLDSGSRLRPWE